MVSGETSGLNWNNTMWTMLGIFAEGSETELVELCRALVANGLDICDTRTRLVVDKGVGVSLWKPKERCGLKDNIYMAAINSNAVQKASLARRLGNPKCIFCTQHTKTERRELLRGRQM